ncbi:MAG: DUF2179 domain-containing protein [Gemmatimonadota bacterium]|jgi:uncharacterized protein YebE (UPF0316 family)|nr:DUF2179 domain-containing protein [Gemmatimonadota bacterium]
MEEIIASAWGPLVIFGLRICDVSLATIRMLLSVRGIKFIAPIIGFFEVLIWITAVGTAIQHLDSPLHILGYAGGFAMGTLVGSLLDERMAIGMASIRVVSMHGGVELAEAMRELGFGVTEYAGHGREGTVEVVDAVMRRRDLPQAMAAIDLWDPNAFVTIEEPRSIRHGWLLQGARK